MLWSIIEEFYKKLALNCRKPKKTPFFGFFFEFFSGVGQAFAPEQIAQYLVGLKRNNGNDIQFLRVAHRPHIVQDLLK